MNKTDLSTFQNRDYHPGSTLKRIFWYAVSLLFFQTSFPWTSGIKRGWLRIFGAEIGRGVVIKPAVRIKYPWFLKVGDHAWIGEKVWIDNLAEVRIGAHSCVSQGAMLLTGNHDYTAKSFDLRTQTIYLSEGVWIGAKAVVCPGVNCGSHAVLTVGAVATADLEPYGIYNGVPAEKKRMRQII